MKLDDIALPHHTELIGSHRKTTDDDLITSMLTNALVVRPFMHDIAFSSEHIVLPNLLNMDETPLSPAEGEMLYARERKKLIFRVHDSS